jgi:arylsulfatase A-like enzyme
VNRLASLLLGLCLLLGACARPGIERILLICIERLPATSVGAYGAAPSRTPTLDRLAGEGLRFEVVIAPSLLERPGHASLLTALDPPRHGVRRDADALSAGVPSLPEALSRRGFASAAAFAQPLGQGDPLGRGVDQSLAGEGVAETVDRAIAWLEGAPPRYFLSLHLGARDAATPLNPAELARIDEELGRFLAAFEARPARGESLVVVTSSRASGPETGLALRDADLRVPLVLTGIGLPRGRVVSVPARLVDVAPTILTLARLPGIPGVEGRSLMPLITGKTMPWPYAYAEAAGSARRTALRSPDHKYIRADPPALYDLRADPRERRNIASQRPEVVRRLDGLLALRAAHPGVRPRNR